MLIEGTCKWDFPERYGTTYVRAAFAGFGWDNDTTTLRIPAVLGPPLLQTSDFTLQTSPTICKVVSSPPPSPTTTTLALLPASRAARSTYDYDPTGIRILALNEIDSNAVGTFEPRTKIEYLVDHASHTSYQQVIRESHFDASTGALSKTVDYTFGHDEISQTVVTYNRNSKSKPKPCSTTGIVTNH